MPYLPEDVQDAILNVLLVLVVVAVMLAWLA